MLSFEFVAERQQTCFVQSSGVTAVAWRPTSPRPTVASASRPSRLAPIVRSLPCTSTAACHPDSVAHSQVGPGCGGYVPPLSDGTVPGVGNG